MGKDFAPAAETVIACIESQHGIDIAQFEPLDSGADPDAAVYRLVSSRAERWFLKVIRGEVPGRLLAVAHWLASSRSMQVVAPIALPATGALALPCQGCTLVLYPYLEGVDGWSTTLSQSQWQALGASLRALHDSELPEHLAAGLARETFSDRWRRRLIDFLDGSRRPAPSDPAAKGLAALLRDRRGPIEALSHRAGQLARGFEARAVELRLCHGDIHAGNILVTPDGQIHLVDWQTLILAPRERDLMFIGGGVGGVWNTAHESPWFYEGYGDSPIDRELLAYYRCERIVQDVVVYCEQLFMSDQGGDGRMRSLRQLAVQFEANNVVEIAQATDAELPKR